MPRKKNNNPINEQKVAAAELEQKLNEFAVSTSKSKSSGTRKKYEAIVDKLEAAATTSQTPIVTASQSADTSKRISRKKADKLLDDHAMNFDGFVVFPELNRNQTRIVGMSMVPCFNALMFMRSIIVACKKSVFYGVFRSVTDMPYVMRIITAIPNRDANSTDYYTSVEPASDDQSALRLAGRIIEDWILRTYGQTCRVNVEENNFTIVFSSTKSTFEFVYNSDLYHPICKCINSKGPYIEHDKKWLRMFGLM